MHPWLPAELLALALMLHVALAHFKSYDFSIANRLQICLMNLHQQLPQGACHASVPTILKPLMFALCFDRHLFRHSSGVRPGILAFHARCWVETSALACVECGTTQTTIISQAGTEWQQCHFLTALDMHSNWVARQRDQLRCKSNMTHG